MNRKTLSGLSFAATALVAVLSKSFLADLHALAALIVLAIFFLATRLLLEKLTERYAAVRIDYFVHATTTDNERGLATGWEPGELSAVGIERAKNLGGLISDKHFDIVFCSDLKRAVDSAHLIFGDRHRIVQDKRLREIDYGDFTKTEAGTFKRTMADYIDSPFPNGESYRDVEKRLREFCSYLRSNHRGQYVAVVGHQAPQLALDVLLKNLSWQQAIAADWRRSGSWQPGWNYTIK